jgi:hypothetical protein
MHNASSCLFAVFLLFAVLFANPAVGNPQPFRGLYFNPQIEPGTDYPWLLHYDAHRETVRHVLRELADETRINFVAIFLLMPHTLAVPKQAPAPGQALAQWANVDYLGHVAQFIDDCAAEEISVGLDMANNLWVPYAVDTANHRVGVPDEPPDTDPWWPVADDTPWDESVTWYTQIIAYVETKTQHPDRIAWWCMGGSYALGGAESVLWMGEDQPELLACTERFVKEVWPAFRAAGKRPKAAPYALPIFSTSPYWSERSPEDRLRAFTHLKQWLIDDLHQPPDYWPMSTYPYCDPAPDGYHYLRRIVEILGTEQAARIVSTDFKGPGHEHELADSVIVSAGHSGAAMLDWHFQQCREYGFAGWWIWAYQDTATDKTGLRSVEGTWKPALVEVVRRQASLP